MNHDIFEKCLAIYHELCGLVEEDYLSEDYHFNNQLKKDFESLFNYFNALTDSEEVKLEDFVG